MNTDLKLQHTNDLSAVETVLIENIYSIVNRREKLIKDIIANCEDYKKVIEAAEELKHIHRYHGTLHDLKEQFFQHASVQTLTRIVNEEKFTPVYNFQDAFSISKLVLKEFGYGSDIKADNPKAQIAKKLGAKITL